MKKVLGRWPNAPLSENALVAALLDEQKFHILVEKRPSIEISTEVIENVYSQNGGSESTPRIIMKVLELQPNSIITENLLEAVALNDYSFEGVHRQLFNILLRRIPHANSTDLAIRRSMAYGLPLAQLTLEARPDLKLSPSCFGSICSQLSNDDPEDQIILDQLLKRLSGPGLDENGMLEFVPECTPNALTKFCQKYLMRQ
ncbi:hypothetical protein EAE96_005978 [Botrytis aclada]|nr:hypothetical protein EAE96_005978 [Botrytis aclada]